VDTQYLTWINTLVLIGISATHIVGLVMLGTIPAHMRKESAVSEERLAAMLDAISTRK
jgi:hypothetical protein